MIFAYKELYFTVFICLTVVSVTAQWVIMNDEKQKQRILNDGLWKLIFDFSWPAVVAMALLGANNVLDGIFVGRLVGREALAGISVVLPPLLALIGFALLCGTGAGSLLSIAIGAGDKDIQKKLLGNMNTLMFMSALFLMCIGFAFSHRIVFLMGGRGEALALGETYYRTLLYGAPFWIYAIASNALIRSEGKMKTGALIMACGLLCNACANYILMVIFGMGIRGAALGTNIGMALQSFIGIAYFLRKPLAGEFGPLRQTFAFRFDKNIIAKISGMGLSAFIMQIMMGVQSVLVLNVLNAYGGEADIAFYGVVTRLFSFVVQPLSGLMIALPPIIGINFGAAKTDRVIAGFKYFLAAALALIIPFWLCLLIFPEGAVSIMMKNSSLSASDMLNFRLYMALLPVMPLSFLTLAFFPVINKGHIASIIGILQQIVLYVPAMLVLPIFAGVAGVYYGTFLIELTTALPILILLKREFRLLRTGLTKWEG